MEQKHSGLGIASFALSLVVGFFLLMLFAVIAAMEFASAGGVDENSPATMVLGLLIFAGLFAALIALGLGIAGLLQPNRAKVFAVLGTVFSALTIAGLGVVMLIGALAG